MLYSPQMSQTLYPPTGTIRRHRFTADEYLRMAEGGFLSSNRVELINGEIIDMPAQQNDHAYGIRMMLNYLDATFPQSKYWVRIQSSLRLGESVPDPDLAVVLGPPHGGKGIPVTALLVAEVSDSTLHDDLNRKASLYASGGIADYWVLDIPNRQVHIHRKPMEDAQAEFGSVYSSVGVFRLDQEIEPLAALGFPVKVITLFPPIQP